MKIPTATYIRSWSIDDSQLTLAGKLPLVFCTCFPAWTCNIACRSLPYHPVGCVTVTLLRTWFCWDSAFSWDRANELHAQYMWTACKDGDGCTACVISLREKDVLLCLVMSASDDCVGWEHSYYWLFLILAIIYLQRSCSYRVSKRYFNKSTLRYFRSLSLPKTFIWTLL